MIAVLGALAAISGCGGLTNTTISSYTRDQGWGMGKEVGAIPSVVGGRKLKLSHVGRIADLTEPQTLARFRRWFRFVVRDQLVVWMPACFIGIALPSMLSMQFLPRGTQVDEWTASGMTADGLRHAAGPTFGPFCWWMTLFCGFLVLAPSAATTADGGPSPLGRRLLDRDPGASPLGGAQDPLRLLRRAVLLRDLRRRDAEPVEPVQLLKWAGNIYNAALGSVASTCWR
jgi:hypothetical protein